VACGSRDHTLSDLIGFTYASWSADGAATDFVYRIVEAGRRYSARTQGGEATVFVILDGENAWEHYEGQGRPFLRALYGALASHPEVRTVTMAEACAGATEALPSIFPGSWIHGDFYIWIGHADDHRAWSQLGDARRVLESAGPAAPEPARARAHEELLIAEGSDWFWWYGDDHSSDHDLEFDDLFRRHVRNVYRALDQPIPEELFVSNITTQPPEVEIQAPTGFIHPEIDGELTDYFEWIGAGSVDGTPAAAGAMHQVADAGSTLTLIEFGFNLEELFLRFDAPGPIRELLGRGLEIRVKFVQPAAMQIRIGLQASGVTAQLEERRTRAAWTALPGSGVRAAVGSVLEVRIPFADLDAGIHEPVAFLVTLNRGSEELEQHPRHRPIEVTVPGPEFVARAWTA
jgi:hypothetical protein